MADEIERLKKKVKKITKTLDNQPSEEELGKLYDINCKLEKERTALLNQIEDLKEEYERDRSRNIVEV